MVSAGIKVKGTDLDRVLGLQEVQALRIFDNRHMKVARLWALRAGRFTPQGDPCYSFLLDTG